MYTNLKALIFDMDGLMVDTERLYVQVQNEMLGRPVPASIVEKMMGQKPIDSISILIKEMGLSDSPEAMLSKRTQLLLDLMRNDLQAMPGLYELIREFQGRVPLAIGTGSSQEILNIVLQRLDLNKTFEVLQTSDDVTQGKPHPEIYEKTVSRLGIPARDIVVLEDSANGIKAARAAGCIALAVPSEYTRGQDFSGAHQILRDLYEVREFLLKGPV